MTAANPCDLPPAAAGGCCEAAPAAPFPAVPDNRPGLSAVRYRVATFGTARRAMLDDVAALAKAPQHPFAGWREGAAGDYLTALVELWAYLADVLTFYQERILNEALLPTAARRESLTALARLLGYRPAPGAAAGAAAAFTVEKGKTVEIPAGFKVGSEPGPGRPPATFETAAALTAVGARSAIPLSAVAPTNQFAPLSAYIEFVTRSPAVASFTDLAKTLFAGGGVAIAETIAVDPFWAAAPAESVSDFVGHLPTLAYAGRLFYGKTTRPVVLKGAATRLAAGDHVVVVASKANGGEVRDVRRIETVRPDKATDTTTITWDEESGDEYKAGEPVNLYALRTPAALFGNTAPDWRTLSPTLRDGTKYPDAPFKEDWTGAAAPAGKCLDLDGTYAVKASAAAPNWAAARVEGESGFSVFRVDDARTVTASGYSLTLKVTRLTVDPPIGGGALPIRKTSVLTGAEHLPLQNNLPLPEPLTGQVLVLAGQHDLAAGQLLVLRGSLFDAEKYRPLDEVGAEEVTPAESSSVDAENDLTTVRLTKPLSRPYTRAGAVLLGNVVRVTHGETVADETLGDGTGGPFQTFPLKKAPVTYLPATDAEGAAGVASTLRVTVNGVRWDEQPTPAASGPADPHYTAPVDDAGRTVVQFGGEGRGAAPPAGAGNVRARYRVGLGAAGNLPTGDLNQLLDNRPGLQRVTNPLPAGGGADPDSAADVRAKAPAGVRTFGRAVTAGDYAALARAFPGVAKAGAAWLTRDPETGAALPQPYLRLTVVTADRVPLARQATFARSLRAYLDRRRDPNVPLRVIDFDPVVVALAVALDLDDRYPREGTTNRVRDALTGPSGLLSFDLRELGRGVNLAEVYAAVHSVAGVRGAAVTTLRPEAASAPEVWESIPVRPTALAVAGGVRVRRRTGGYLDT